MSIKRWVLCKFVKVVILSNRRAIVVIVLKVFVVLFVMIFSFCFGFGIFNLLVVFIILFKCKLLVKVILDIIIIVEFVSIGIFKDCNFIFIKFWIFLIINLIIGVKWVIFWKFKF